MLEKSTRGTDARSPCKRARTTLIVVSLRSKPSVCSLSLFLSIRLILSLVAHTSARKEKKIKAEFGGWTDGRWDRGDDENARKSMEKKAAAFWQGEKKSATHTNVFFLLLILSCCTKEQKTQFMAQVVRLEMSLNWCYSNRNFSLFYIFSLAFQSFIPQHIVVLHDIVDDLFFAAHTVQLLGFREWSWV